MHKIIFILSFFALVLGSANAAVSPEYYRNFWNPAFHGERLNYCSMDGKCGLPVASIYCKMMGYENADKQLIDNNVGLTNFIANKAQCRGWTCNGFKLIRCIGKINHQPPASYHYRSHRFPFPRYEKYRVAWCYKDDTGCGKKAANSFCRRMGFDEANKFIKQERVSATKALSDQKLCFGNQCSGFSVIDCYR